MRKGVPPLLLFAVLLPLTWLAARALPRLAFDLRLRAVAGVALMATGLVACVVAAAQFRRVCTTVDPNRPERVTTLVTAGLFRISRNPMYVAFTMFLAGWGLVLANWAALLVPLAYAYYLNWRQIPREEQALAARFGDSYRDYARRVRRWL